MNNKSDIKKRNAYLTQLIGFQNKTPIKVITGVRRCGKSTLFDLFEAHLREQGIADEQIIRMNFEYMLFDEIRDYRQLYRYVKEHMVSNGTTYLLLDEVQRVTEWERAVNSLHAESAGIDGGVDIYVTGSNAYLLASELSTLLSGRYVEIKMLPLSFEEFLDFGGAGEEEDRTAAFHKYLQTGGFPGAIEFIDQPQLINTYLEGIYNTIILKDIVQRNAVRDPALLEDIVRYLTDNIGNLITTKKISGYLTSQGRKTSADTIDNYMRMLEKAFIFYRARRYDLKGKTHLKSNEKYYLVDTGIRNFLLGKKAYDYGFVLENVIYFELLRRGYEVSIGKYEGLEVDFVAVNDSGMAYYQVCASITAEETRQRELRPLQRIGDNYEKYILTMDRLPYDDFEGIRLLNIVDFLVHKNRS